MMITRHLHLFVLVIKTGNIKGRIVVGASSVVGIFITKTHSNILVDLEIRTDDEIERIVRIGSIDDGLTLKFTEDHFFV